MYACGCLCFHLSANASYMEFSRENHSIITVPHSDTCVMIVSLCRWRVPTAQGLIFLFLTGMSHPSIVAGTVCALINTQMLLLQPLAHSVLTHSATQSLRHSVTQSLCSVSSGPMAVCLNLFLSRPMPPWTTTFLHLPPMLHTPFWTKRLLLSPLSFFKTPLSQVWWCIPAIPASWG
jgi:hypothetical protein